MSGIVGIAGRAEPVDRGMLERMTSYLSFRGPDVQQVWVDRRVGFGHALLETTDDGPQDRQPLSLDGTVFITADARIDGRTQLADELKLEPTPAVGQWTDAELILRAYLAWGDECTAHLLGDFAFAIWDGRSERLFCVRDQLGVKPFFYATPKSGLVFSNTLSCLRQHPDVSDELNDQAIADFLLFGYNAEPDTTAFADVRRLPAAHALEWTTGGVRVRPYWRMPVREPLRYKNPGDYVERFGELLHTAVADRLRTSRVAISMSGGLDSSSIAATAQDVLASQGRRSGLHAWTTVFETIPDQERHYAGLVAAKLGIPISYQIADRYKLHEIRGHRAVCPPEPRTLFGAARQFDELTQVVEHSRVMLTGQGGDVILRPSASYLFDTMRRGNLGQFVGDVWRHVRAHRRLPRLGVRTLLRRRTGAKGSHPPFPDWIEPTFAARLALRSRFAEVHGRRPEPNGHHRPEAYDILMSAQWSRLFESVDADVTGFPIEYRHPLFDLRLVDFALAIPTMPWCVDKALVREIMRGKLPEEVRCRRKTPLAGNPLTNLLEELGGGPQPPREAPAFRRYVRRDDVPGGPGQAEVSRQRLRSRPFYLNLWLESLQFPQALFTQTRGGE